MLNYVLDTAAVQGATDRLLTAVSGLDEPAIAAPSRLPGWSRGHVLAHLARNADALVNLLTWARTGEERRMYASDETRDAEIERDAARPGAVHLDDLRSSALHFHTAATALGQDRWDYSVALRDGVTERAEGLPFRRLVEVELHHVDLGIGYTLADLPTAFVRRELDMLTAGKLAGHREVPPLLLDEGSGRPRSTGRPAALGDPPLTVTGSPSALLGWLTGRADGSELSCVDGSLPDLPPLP